jgi:exodeoxyribonuclease-3
MEQAQAGAAAPIECEMKIATYNVNSIRKRLPLVLRWLEQHQPDVMCLQETKVQDCDFPLQAIRDLGYHVCMRGMKGYNGVATLSRQAPERVRYGLEEGPDSEDVRILQTVVGGIPIVNTYVPQGYKVGTDKYAFKLQWFERVRRYFEKYLDPEKPALWVGDVNVAPEPVDVYHPDRRVNDVDFHIDARNAYKRALSWGFVDVFRKLHPDRVQYTYWDYFRNAFQNNWGWRIDHILATRPLAERCRAADVDIEPRRAECASDHTVVWADFDLEGIPRA